MSKIGFSLACASVLLLAAPAVAQAPEPLSIVVFGPPSLGAHCQALGVPVIGNGWSSLHFLATSADSPFRMNLT